MEQITRRDGIVYYGNIPCKSVKDAYGRFRADYHGELGRRVYRRLDARARKERLHGFKSFYTERYSLYLAEQFGGFERVACTLMGIVGISYCYAIGGWDLPDMEEERRLCYVGITRAMDHLTLTGANMRMLRGQFDWYRESRFLKELPHTEKEFSREKPRSPFVSSPKPWEMPPKKKETEKPYFLSGGSVSAAASEPDYDVGDTVQHVKFGTGIVKEIRDGGRDKEVTVEFERFGVKKMFAGFAKLKKIYG